MRNRNLISAMTGKRRPRKDCSGKRRPSHSLRPLLEFLEDRRLLTGSTLYVNDNWVVTNDVAPPGLSAGDTVANTGAGDDGTVTGKIFGTNAFSTLQDAVNAANSGDTIDVLSGTYIGITDVDKSLTFIGEQAGVDARSGRAGAEESILSLGYNNLQINADGITFDGFTIVNTSNSNTNGLVASFGDANSFTLENTIVEDTAAASSGTILFSSGSHTNMSFDQDLFEDQGIASLYFGGGPGDDNYDGLQITNSKFVGLAGGVFDAATDPLTDVLIQGNEFDGTVDGTPGVGDPLLNIGASVNMTIADNYFHDMDYTAFQVGMDGGSITGNTFSRIYADPGAGLGDDFQLWGGEYGTTVSTNVDITNNIINYNDVPGATDPSRGIRLRAPDSGAGIDGTTIHINDNEFVNGGVLAGVDAIVDQGDPTKPVDASANWWSTTDDSTILSAISGPADITPFFATGTNTAVGSGFQGDYSDLDVTTLGYQDGATGRIQEGVNLATSGGTINVLAGTYSESVNVNKTVALLGAEHGVDARTRNATETILDGTTNGGDTLLNVSADDVTIDGFTIQGATNTNVVGAGVWLEPSAYGTQFLNNIVQNNITGLYLSNASSTDQAVVEQNLFQNNTQAGPTSGTDIYADQYTAGVGGVDDVLIEDNTFTNSSFVEDSWGVGISNTDPTTSFTGITVSNNSFSNTGRGMYFYDSTNVTVTDNVIDGATHYGIGMFGNDGSPANASFTISGNTFTNDGAGVELVDDTSAAAYTGTLTLSSNIFASTTTTYVDDESATSVDATDNTFAGTAASSATLAQLYAIEDQIIDGIDVSGFGLVRIVAGTVYVTTNSFDAADGTTTPSLQRAIDAASSGDTIDIEAGTYTGNVDASSKSVTLSPGGSGVAALVRITGNLVLGSLDTLAMDINGPTAGTQYDQISTTGTVNLNSDSGTGAMLAPTLAMAYMPSEPIVFTLISNGSGSPVAPAAPTPKFDGLPEGAQFFLGSTLMTLSYVGGAGHDVTLAHVNQAPSFTAGPNQWVYINSGPQTVTNWATNITDGPGDMGQTLNFIVTNNDNNLFSTQPAISPTGTLTYTPAPGATGSATVTVQLHDNGGTGMGGVDTSAPQIFYISIPTKLAITTQPPSTVPDNAPFGLVVTAEDANGNPALGFSGSVTVALASGPGGTLGGTLVVSAVNGAATFSGLTLNQVGSGYTLLVTSDLLTSITSIPITVIPGLEINTPATDYATIFQPGGLAVENTSGVTINDSNSIAGATIQITNVRDGSSESLTANLGVSGLTSMYNVATGTLTIVGSATVATYETVLETVMYNDVAASPTTATRNIQFTVTDAMNLKSNVAIATVSVIGNYIESGGPGSTQSPNVDTPNPTIVIDSSGVVSATSVTSATVSISSGFVSSTEDVLGLSNQFQQNYHITLSSPLPGEIVLTGTSQTTPVEYQLELDAITYTDTAHVFAPSDLQKTFTFTILTNTGYSVSDVKIYNITPVDTNPTVTTTTNPLTYTAQSGAQLVDSGVTVTDPDPLSVTGATVSISSGFFVGQDTLSETAPLPMGVSALYNSSTGILTLTGSASLSQYQTLLAGVAYTNSGLNLSSRTISFVVDTGSLGSNVTGNNRYTKTISMTPATVTRYDFNSNASTSTASGAPGFIGVGPGRGYSQSNGYGFSDAVTNFTPFTASTVESIAGISSTYAPMYEDGIVSSINSPQEFTFSTTVGTTYDLRVYVGNPNVSTNNIQVTIYTGSITNLLQTQIGQVTGIATTAGGSSAFTTVELDGLTAGGVTTAAGSEITVVIKSTTGSVYTEGLDVALHGDLPAIAHQDPAGGIAPAGSPPVSALTTSELQPVVAQAIADWAAAGITPAQVAALQSTQFVISDLDGQGALALTGANTVQIDSTADGYGWFVDPSLADSPAAGQMDLLTVVTHELGHILGLPDVSAALLPGDLMDTTLPTGTRRLPSSADMAALATGSYAPTTAPAASSASTAAVLATSLSSGSSPTSTSGIDQALAQVSASAADDDSESDEDGLLETASALDSFFTLLG